MSHTLQPVEVERQTMDVDIACAGFGPATGGFLTTLAQAWSQNPSDPVFESRVASGMPLQIVCYERADDLAAGVSGVVTRGEGIRASFPALDPAQIPMAAQVKQERILYLLDPIGASRRRSRTLRVADLLLYLGKRQWVKDNAFELPWTPAFLHKQRRPGAFDRPVQPVGRLATDGHRLYPDMARHARRRAHLLGRRERRAPRRLRRPPRRSGRG